MKKQRGWKLLNMYLAYLFYTLNFQLLSFKPIFLKFNKTMSVVCAIYFIPGKIRLTCSRCKFWNKTVELCFDYWIKFISKLLLFCHWTGEYDQNLCQAGVTSCAPCPDRLPSCVGLPDGDEPDTLHQWTNVYVRCYRNRTMKVEHCPVGSVFSPASLACISKIGSGKFYVFKFLTNDKKLK